MPAAPAQPRSRRKTSTTGFVQLDVTDDAQWERAVAATVATLGGYDILINNAGIEITSLVTEVKAEDARRMCDVNIVGTVLGMKHAFRAMRPGGPAGKGGAVVNIASVAATIAFPEHRGLFGHQIRGRPHDAGRSDGSRQARFRRARQLHLSGPDPDRHGHAARQRHRQGRARGRRQRRGRLGGGADPARPSRRGHATSPMPRCSCARTRPASSPASDCRSTAAWACSNKADNKHFGGSQ